MPRGLSWVSYMNEMARISLFQEAIKDVECLALSAVVSDDVEQSVISAARSEPTLNSPWSEDKDRAVVLDKPRSSKERLDFKCCPSRIFRASEKLSLEPLAIGGQSS